MSRRLLLVLNDPQDFLGNRRALAEAARAAGWDVHVAAPAEPAAARIAAAGWPFHPVALDRLGMRPWREAVAVASLARLLRRLRPQVAHLRAVKPILAGGLAARATGGCAVVSHFCGLGYLFTGGGAVRRALRMALWPSLRASLSLPRQAVVASNPDDGGALLRLGLADPGRLVVIPGSGVDCRRFHPVPEPAGAFTVVLPARLLRAKGIAEFAAVARLLRGQGVRCILVGGTAAGNVDAIDPAEVAAWCAEGILEWWGERQDMPQVLAAAHVVAFPSHREGLPRAILEAAASGRAVVATDVPGNRTAVEHGSTGILVPLGDAAAMASAILALRDDAGLRSACGARARRLAVRRFASERINASFLSLYDLLCRRGNTL